MSECVWQAQDNLEIDLDQTILEVETSVVIVFRQGEKGKKYILLLQLLNMEAT